MINILILAIFILPWLIIPDSHLPDPTRIIKSTAFDMIMLLIISMAIIKGMKFEYKNKYLGWVAICLFTGFYFNWYYPLLMGYGFNAGTIEANIHFVLSLFATICVCSTFERSDFVRISKAIVFSTTLVACFAFLQVIGLDPMKNIAKYNYKEHRHICALLDHPDILGNYLAISVPFFLYLLRPKYIIPLLIVGIVLFFVHSSISIVAALVATMVFLFLRYRNNRFWRYGILGSFILLIGLCLNPSFNKMSNGFTGRSQAWVEILHRADNPIFGQGLGIVKSYMVVFGDNHWAFAHNDYIEMYCSGGIVLLFLFSLLLINSFRNFNYKEDNVLGFAFLASLISFLIVMFGSFPMEIAPLALGGLIAWWGVEKVS